MAETQKNNPLHGITLKMMLEELVATYGFEELGNRINIRCFRYDPSIKSSLTFKKNTMGKKKKLKICIF